jgi:hypothetical protein
MESPVDEHQAGSRRHPDGEAGGGRGQSADDGDAQGEDREAELAAREAQVEAHEARSVEREQETKKILAAADERDVEAELRDQVADEREKVASLQSFIHDKEYDAALRARRASALDRFDSKTDRSSGASDRAKLSERDPQNLDPDD